MFGFDRRTRTEAIVSVLAATDFGARAEEVASALDRRIEPVRRDLAWLERDRRVTSNLTSYRADADVIWRLRCQERESRNG